ncbi:DNA-directed RNA polymerase subunit beta [Nocardia sp. NBC_00508]|uniref:DNA-directed RNA polymerase subunit beta n=1 Tax=Nocardia sp. NBC_00508 TaxID=2975992 RepID=UPI002E81D624|nr:DNA-directed RNA polymerase subunit beta [Nocardia sp. NBC_00508]WUD67238.1 DNA-directed RNA polymerase subunit beta [Nocardia sp. NBC_00508]
MSAPGIGLRPSNSGTVAGRVAFYKRVANLAAEAEPDRIIVRASKSVCAICMPEPIGMAVVDAIRTRSQSLGPIVAHPRSHTWTFLARPDLPDIPEVFTGLFRYQVKVITSGGVIALPSPLDEQTGFRSWIEAPHDTYRPSARVLLDTVRACLPARRQA